MLKSQPMPLCGIGWKGEIMGEIQEAAQVFVVAVQGIEIAFKLTGEITEMAIKLLQKLVKFLDAMLRHERMLGKVNMKELLKSGVDLECCQIPQERIKEFEKLSKKYGILYSKVPSDKNGMADIIFRAGDVQRMNLVFERMGLGELQAKSVLDYVNDMPEKEIVERIAPEDIEIITPNDVKKSLGPNDIPVLETQKETIDDVTRDKMRQAYQDYSRVKNEMNQTNDSEAKERLNQVAMNIQRSVLMNHPSYEEISIATRNKNGTPLLVDETEEKIKVRIPYEMHKFIWLDKKEAFLSEDRKNIAAFLRKDRTYVVVDEKNWEVDRMSGRELYQKHYDPVHRKRQKTTTKQKSQNIRKSKEKTMNR